MVVTRARVWTGGVRASGQGSFCEVLEKEVESMFRQWECDRKICRWATQVIVVVSSRSAIILPMEAFSSLEVVEGTTKKIGAKPDMPVASRGFSRNQGIKSEARIRK